MASGSAPGRRRTEGASSELYATLLDGMHAMAQPLTILQSRFFLALSEDAEASISQQLLTDASADIDHLCTLFRLMRQLVCVQGAAARMVERPLSIITDGLIVDAEAVLMGTRLEFKLRLPSSPLPCLLMEAERTRQALLQMLLVARALADPPGGNRLASLLCTVVIGASRAKVQFVSGDAADFRGELPLAEEDQLRVAVAKANMLSQSGTFQFTQQPFLMTLTLPITGRLRS